MPKQTFFNLPADKRDLIMRLAVDEFADNDYETASISRVVAAAGIAKGSFYQYFEDKLDLYEYLLAEGARLKVEFLTQHPPPEGHMNLFTYMRELVRVGLAYEFAYPRLAKIAQRALMGQGPYAAAWGRQVEAQAMRFFGDLLAKGQAAGTVRADLDVEMAAHVLYASTRDMGSYMLDRLNLDAETDGLLAALVGREAEVEAVFDQLFNVLEHGFGTKGES